ncbi:Mss51 [Symbiodinium sp. KB8]|nr:Mss51 [Symbiodinium sp. KB8]
MGSADTTDMSYDAEKNETTPLQPGVAETAYSGKAADQLAEVDTDRLLPPKNQTPKGGFVHLDVTRIVCVFLVAIDHGDGKYSEWNVIWDQQWTLQWIVLVCGIAFCLSSKPLLNFLLRLGLYVAIGIVVNWAAWIGLGMDWKHDFFNVIFQMWFVIGLMLYCIILNPLRSYLAEDTKNLEEHAKEKGPYTSSWLGAPPEEGMFNSILMMLFVVIAIGIVCAVFLPMIVNPFLAPAILNASKTLGGAGNVWGLPSTYQEAEDFVACLCRYAFLTLSNLFLMRAIRSTNIKPSFIPWVMLANSAVNRSGFYRGPEERPFHLLDLMILSMVSYAYGVRYRKIVGDYFCRYWFLVLIAFALTWPPSLHVRLDVHPTHDLILRSKAEIMETICILAWLCASDRFFPREIFTEDRLGFLNDWALLLFLVHKAVHMIFGLPLSWFVLVGLMPVAWVFRSEFLCARAETAETSGGFQPYRMFYWQTDAQGRPAHCWETTVLHDRAKGWPGLCLGLFHTGLEKVTDEKTCKNVHGAEERIMELVRIPDTDFDLDGIGTCWEDYFATRGMAPQNRAACTGALSVPLTILHAIRSFNMELGDEELCIDLPGSRILELTDMELVYEELGRALPESGATLRLIGPELGRELPLGSELEIGNVRLTFHRTMYQDFLTSAGPPDLAVAFHAGIQEYESWHPALRALVQLRVPTAITSYSLSDAAGGLWEMRRRGTHPSMRFQGVNPFACSERLAVDEAMGALGLLPDSLDAQRLQWLQSQTMRAGGLLELAAAFQAQGHDSAKEAEAVSINSWWCWLGNGGYDCDFRGGNQNGITVQAAQRLQHGKVHVMKSLVGIKVNKLYNFGLYAEGSQELSISRCRDWCYSSISCEYWQYSKNDGCWVDAPSLSSKRGNDVSNVVDYPLTAASVTTGTPEANSMIAGEYITHYCPPEQAPIPIVAGSSASSFVVDRKPASSGPNPTVLFLSLLLVAAAIGGLAYYCFVVAGKKRKGRDRVGLRQQPEADEDDDDVTAAKMANYGGYQQASFQQPPSPPRYPQQGGYSGQPPTQNFQTPAPLLNQGAPYGMGGAGGMRQNYSGQYGGYNARVM